MNRTSFYGEIYTTDSEIVRSTLAEWLHADDLKTRVKIFGEHIVYEGDNIYVFAENSTQPGQRNFLFQGHTGAGLDETRQKLGQLRDLFKARNIKSDFDYVVVNESGEEISEEFQVR